MQVNSISTISFAGTEGKTDNKQKRDNYYKYVSQVNANDALKMSVGREVTDGKFKVAEGASKTSSALGFGMTGLYMINMISKAAKVLNETKSRVAVNEVIQKSRKPIMTGLVVSSALLAVGNIIAGVNAHLANKTSKERGFIAPLTRFENMQEAYKATEDVYNSRVKK